MIQSNSLQAENFVDVLVTDILTVLRSRNFDDATMEYQMTTYYLQQHRQNVSNADQTTSRLRVLLPKIIRDLHQ